MAIITTYKCDKCGKTWDSTDKSEQICTLKLEVSLDSTIAKEYKLTNVYNPIKYTNHWCRTCVMSSGMVFPKTSKDQEQAPYGELTTSEKITDFISALGFVHQDD